MVTTVWPALVVWVGVLAPTQVPPSFANTELAAPGLASPLSGTNPPVARPFGTEDAAPIARPRALFCTACMAWIACADRVSAFCAVCATCAEEIAAFIAEFVGLTVADEQRRQIACAGVPLKGKSASALTPDSSAAQNAERERNGRAASTIAVRRPGIPRPLWRKNLLACDDELNCPKPPTIRK